MAQFKSKHAFLTVHVNGKKINFYQGVAVVDDSEKAIISALEAIPYVERVQELVEEKAEQEEQKAEEEKPKAKSTKRKPKTEKSEK
jgi:hypothetical protein